MRVLPQGLLAPIGGVAAGVMGVQSFIVVDGMAMIVVGVLAVLSRGLKELDGRSDANELALSECAKPV